METDRNLPVNRCGHCGSASYQRIPARDTTPGVLCAMASAAALSVSLVLRLADKAPSLAHRRAYGSLGPTHASNVRPGPICIRTAPITRDKQRQVVFPSLPNAAGSGRGRACLLAGCPQKKPSLAPPSTWVLTVALVNAGHHQNADPPRWRVTVRRAFLPRLRLACRPFAAPQARAARAARAFGLSFI